MMTKPQRGRKVVIRLPFPDKVPVSTAQTQEKSQINSCITLQT